MASRCIHRESAVVLFLILNFITVQWSSAANILILCYPSFSHNFGPANVGKVLQDQGHNVTIAIPPQIRAKLEDKGVNLLMYDSLGDMSELKEAEQIVLDNFFQGKSEASAAFDLMKVMVIKILRDQQLMEDIKACKPDLMILDSTPSSRMLTIVAYKFDIPFVFIGSFAAAQISCTPILPSVVPNILSDFTDQMTFQQRFVNTFMEFLPYFYDPFISPTGVRDYAPGKPYISMHDLQAKALLWIVSEHSVLDYNPPTMPNIKHIGHLVTMTPQPLPQEFQSFVDNAKHGVVVVTFGSSLKNLPLGTWDKLFTAFEQTKYRFIIRYSMSNSSRSDKLLFSDWLPQYDLLHHKNTRLFITHCGSNGQQEAVLTGVPMIGVPLYADQPHNAERIVRKGFGLRLDLKTFVVEDLVSAIDEVITNPEYKAHVQKASAIMRADRVPPVEEAAFWINHVLTFGADHLRSWGQDIPLWQYLGLDILAVCFLAWHICLFIFIKLVCFCFYRCCQRKEKIKKQ